MVIRALCSPSPERRETKNVKADIRQYFVRMTSAVSQRYSVSATLAGMRHSYDVGQRVTPKPCQVVSLQQTCLQQPDTSGQRCCWTLIVFLPPSSLVMPRPCCCLRRYEARPRRPKGTETMTSSLLSVACMMDRAALEDDMQ